MTSNTDSTPTEFRDLSLESIKLPPVLVRSDPSVDEEFLESMKEDQIEPIVVRPLDSKSFELICGYRRFMAAKAAAKKTISCKIVRVSDEEACTMMLVENDERKSVNPMDKAHFVDEMMHRFGLSLEQISQEKLHKDKSTISNLLRVYHNPVLCERVRKGKHSIQSALELLTLEPDRETQQGLHDEWVSFVDKTESMTAAAIRSLIAADVKVNLKKKTVMKPEGTPTSAEEGKSINETNSQDVKKEARIPQLPSWLSGKVRLAYPGDIIISKREAKQLYDVLKYRERYGKLRAHGVLSISFDKWAEDSDLLVFSVQELASQLAQLREHHHNCKIGE